MKNTMTGGVAQKNFRVVLMDGAEPWAETRDVAIVRIVQDAILEESLEMALASAQRWRTFQQLFNVILPPRAHVRKTKRQCVPQTRKPLSSHTTRLSVASSG